MGLGSQGSPVGIGSGLASFQGYTLMELDYVTVVLLLDGGGESPPEYLDCTVTIWWNAFVLSVARYVGNSTLECIYKNIPAPASRKIAKFLPYRG